MRYFAILDDRLDGKETLMRVLPLALPPGWGLIECPLLASADDYPTWLYQNQVCVLIVDQLLNESVPTGSDPITYKGSDVLRSVQRAMRGFPLVVLTAYPGDADLAANKGKADYVLGRGIFIRELSDYVERLVRHAKKFLEDYQQQLAEFTTLSQKKAQGTTTVDENAKLKALQSLFDWPIVQTQRDDAFDDIEKRLEELERLKREVEPLLKTKGNKP